MRDLVVFDIETVAPVDPCADPGEFPPLYDHRIVVFAALVVRQSTRWDRGLVCDWHATSASTETSTVVEFAVRALDRGSCLWVTWNGRGFDVPVLQLAAMRHDLQFPHAFHRDVSYRYSDAGHVDLCDVMSGYGAARRMSLDGVARAIGLRGKGYIGGEDVAGLVAAGRLAEIEQYCREDVALTALVYARWRALQGDWSLWPALREWVAQSDVAAVLEPWSAPWEGDVDDVPS